MIDLAVAYRVYPGISKLPAFYAGDKFLLSQICLSSFEKSLGALRTKVWAILDGCPPEYESLFRETLSACNTYLTIVSLNKAGNLATFAAQIDLLLKQTEAEYVYFAEDDYFYFPSALEKMVEFMRQNPDVDFVTPYDHPDNYVNPSARERHFVRPFGDRYWRTASSTCLTFLTSRERLRKTHRMFRTYSRGNGDYPLWQSLTQRLQLFNPRIHAHDAFRLKAWLKVWRWGIPSLLTNRRYQLWSPLPTLATHMESTCLAPLVDWQTAFEHFARQRECQQWPAGRESSSSGAS